MPATELIARAVTLMGALFLGRRAGCEDVDVLFMTVPTAGAHPELLRGLIDGCGLPLERIIVVATRADIELPGGVVIIEDLDPPNIQRWWVRGITEAQARGASAVAVCNDDIRLDQGALEQLRTALVETGAAIASPSRKEHRDGLHRRHLIPYSPRLWGSLWVVDVACGLRPDPRYVWWYGDCDLDIRARRDFGGVVLCPVDYEHLHPGEGTAKSPTLVAQTEVDARTFQRDHARLLTLSRWVDRGRRLIGLPLAPS
jgi:hypothetical protein